VRNVRIDEESPNETVVDKAIKCSAALTDIFCSFMTPTRSLAVGLFGPSRRIYSSNAAVFVYCLGLDSGSKFLINQTSDCLWSILTTKCLPSGLTVPDSRPPCDTTYVFCFVGTDRETLTISCPSNLAA
jgi:hypothetical protein